MLNYDYSQRSAIYSEQRPDSYQSLLQRREEVKSLILKKQKRMEEIMKEIDQKAQYSGYIIADNYLIERFGTIDFFNYEKLKKEKPDLYSSYYKESGNQFLRVSNLSCNIP